MISILKQSKVKKVTISSFGIGIILNVSLRAAHATFKLAFQNRMTIL